MVVVGGQVVAVEVWEVGGQVVERPACCAG